MNKSNRKMASKHEDGADLISNLPDDILLVILSGFPSIEELIRTSILSRRCRYLWTSIPSLDIKAVYPRVGEPSEKMKNNKFKELVDYVLLNRSADLDSFRFSCLSCYNTSTVERWIQATVVRNVKRLDLNIPCMTEDENMVMPNCLVTCASLEEFRLSYISNLILPSFSGFPALRVLKLIHVLLLDDDLVKGFLESCPVLEDLTLNFCRLYRLDLLCISCPKLKKLRIVDSFLRGRVKISCPKLVFLELTGWLISTTCVCELQYSVKEAIISLRKIKDTDRLYLGISHVESLTTNFNTLYECMVNSRDPALPNLKNLELTKTNDIFSIKDDKEFFRVLKNCPKLESLSLTIKKDPQAPEYAQMDENETELRSIWTSDLKWIECHDINGENPKMITHTGACGCHVGQQRQVLSLEMMNIIVKVISL